LPGTRIETRAQWEGEVYKRGYNFAYFDGLNSFFIHEAHHELSKAFEVPPNVFDGFVLSGLGSSSFHVDINARIVAERHRIDLQWDALKNTGEMLEGHRSNEREQMSEQVAFLRRQIDILRRELAETHKQLLAAERERERSKTHLALAQKKRRSNLKF
jgi:hypothetical protein